MKSSCKIDSSLQYTVKREAVYCCLLQLYKSQTILEYFPLQFQFENELAVDEGGVCRDVFSAFWEVAFQEQFDGTSLLSPVNHSGIDFEALPLIGTIMSHGYLACGFLPVRLAFPCIVGILRGQVTIPDSVLVESFVDSLNAHESSVMKEAIASKVEEVAFSTTLRQSILGILTRYGCRNLPTPDNLSKLILDAVKYEFVVKPFAAITAMRSGVPKEHQNFWDGMTIMEMYELYRALSANPVKVITLIEGTATTPSEERVLSYLHQFIGTMSCDEIRAFLRFVTGSSVCPSSNIKVYFNNVTGFARRPISHTCDCSLELSVDYRSSIDFINEFRTVLSASEYVWYMDGI